MIRNFNLKKTKVFESLDVELLGKVVQMHDGHCVQLNENKVEPVFRFVLVVWEVASVFLFLFQKIRDEIENVKKCSRKSQKLLSFPRVSKVIKYK